MAVSWRYTPPKVNVAAVIAAAAPLASHAAAEHLLEASRGLVPVEEGVLKASGRVVQDESRAVVTYGRDDDGGDGHAPSNQYVIVQHEDLALNHPNGGSAKFLEVPMNSERDTVAKIVGHELRQALRR
jgi:hypothetical protein